MVKIDHMQRMREGGQRRRITTNSVRSGWSVNVDDLREPRYEMLEGEVE